MAAMDIDSARGKNHAGSPGARDARRKSPRGSVGALGRSSPDAVAKAKRAASDAPERRVLFADSALKPSGDAEGAALDDFGEDSEDEAEAIMPTQAAPSRDRGSSQDRDGEDSAEKRMRDEKQKGEKRVAGPDATAEPLPKTGEPRRSSFGGFARSVASGLGAVGLGAVAAAFTPRGGNVEDSARKAASPSPRKLDAELPVRRVSESALPASESFRVSSSPTGLRASDADSDAHDADADSDAEEERQALEEGRAVFFAKVFEETGVRLHDGWRVSFEWSTKQGSERRRRKRFFSPEGNKFSDATKVIAMVLKQRERGNVDAPILVSGAAMPNELASPGAAIASPRRDLAAATTTALVTAPTPTRTPRHSAGAAGTGGDGLAGVPVPVPAARASPESKDRDPARNVEALRRKVRQKLFHDLEDGWKVEWETTVLNGRERDEKVWRDPAAPGKRLVGDAQALTHVKMRLAAATVQRRAAAEAAAKMAADAKAAEEMAVASVAALAQEVAKTGDATTMVALGAKMEAARLDLQEKREWAAFAAAEAETARMKIANPNLPSPKRGFGVGATPVGKNRRASANAGTFAVPGAPPSTTAATPRGDVAGVSRLPATTAQTHAQTVGGSNPAYPRSTPGASVGKPMSLSMFTPADREEEARRQLVERVYAETGVRLGPEWRVRLSVHSNGKEGNLADREYKRFFSPGGKRFESAGAIVAHVLDFKKRAMAVEGEAAKSPEQVEAERVEDEEFSKQEAAARRELIKQVFEETGVMLGANWRVAMERSWSATKRKLVGRMRFFAPDAKKFSSKADVVEHVERQVRSGKLKRHSAPTRPRAAAAPISARLARNPANLNERDREEEAAAELAERAKEATGVDLSPGWRVRWVKEDGGKVYKRFFDPKGKRYSNLGAAIRQVKRDVGIESPEPEEGKNRRGDDGARNLAAAMDLAADEDEEDQERGGGRRAGSRRIAAAAAAAAAAQEAERARLEKATRPTRAAERAAAEKAALVEKAKAEKAAEKARKAMATAEKALRRAEKAAARSDKEKAARAEHAALPVLAAAASDAIAAEKGDGRKSRSGARRGGIAGPARKMSPTEKEYLAQVTRRVFEELGVELNKGWTVQITQRKSGATSGATDKYFLPPPQPSSAPEGFRTKSKYRSEGEVVEYARRLFGLGSSKKRKRPAGAKDAAAVAAKRAKKKRFEKAKKSVEKENKAKPTEADAAARFFYDATNKIWSPVDTAKTKPRTGGGGASKPAPASKRARERDEDEEEDDGVGDSDDDASDSESASDSDSESESASESESDDSEGSLSDDAADAPASGTARDVRVEGMMTVMDADARRAAFEARVLTPAKVRELERHIDAQLAHPAMGFDVDVLQLEYQRVTGFEAVSDDAVQLREMLQDVVAKEKEKALAAAGGNKHLFSPETRRAVDAAEASAAADAAAEADAVDAAPAEEDVAFPDDDDDEADDSGNADDGKREPEDAADVPDEGDVFEVAADIAVATTVEAMRRVAGSRGASGSAEAPRPAPPREDVSRGARVPRTLGNVGVKRARDDEGDADDSEDEPEEARLNVERLNGVDRIDDSAIPDTAKDLASTDAPVDVPAASLVARGTRFNPTDQAMVAAAKSALHTSTAPGEVLCREQERKTVLDLMRKSLKAKRGGSVYVCGLPGTGKSLTVSEAERVARCWGDGSKLGGGSKHAVGRAERPRVAAVNCMALGDPRLVFAKVIEELSGEKSTNATSTNAAKHSRAADESSELDLGADLGALPEVATLRQLVTSEGSAGGRTTVILLDEMDQLVSKAQGILYELFGLPTLPGSRCVVIGVANGINLVEVTLPRLAARGCEPSVVRFNAYDNTQLKQLLRQRLAALPFAVFEDAGLELCARKVAAATGDMRRALNICTVAVDLCVLEAAETARDSSEASNAGPSSTTSGTSNSKAGEGSDAERQKNEKTNGAPKQNLRFAGFTVKVSHMARAISASFSSPVVDTVRGLPQHQQMVLCAAVRLFRERSAESSKREATLGVLNDKYTALCKEAGIRGVTPGEFSGVCTVLADQTLLKVGAGREDRQRKVSLAVHQDDVVFALQGVNFFRNLIGEGRGGKAGTGRGR